MKRSLTLARRIALSFIGLAILVAGTLGIVSYVSVEAIEEVVFDAQLARTADRLISLHERGEATAGQVPAGMQFLAGDEIAPTLRGLSDGTHELQFDGRIVHVLLRSAGATRYAVVQEIDEFEHTEEVIFRALAVGFVCSVLFAAALGTLAARRMIAPVSALAAAVDRNASAEQLPSLTAQDEIGRLARAFARRTDELERFLARERLFTGDVSHELRTPLTVMLGAAEILVGQLQDRPAQQAAAERVRRVAEETTMRVAALLLLSRATESLDAPRIKLNDLVQAELERCQPLLAGKPVRCALEANGEVEAEVRPELAGIVIGNLLRNACQHTEQGYVLVRLEPGRAVVEDSGSGMPPAVRARLFERFVQGNGTAHDGVGLGLSIVKRVVDHIGWQIRLELPETGGSRFVLEFPMPPAAQRPMLA